MRSPAADLARATGSASLSRPATVGAARVMSNTPPSRSAATDGPTPGGQTRPIKMPAQPSSGRHRTGSSCMDGLMEMAAHRIGFAPPQQLSLRRAKRRSNLDGSAHLP